MTSHLQFYLRLCTDPIDEFLQSLRIERMMRRKSNAVVGAMLFYQQILKSPLRAAQFNELLHGDSYRCCCAKGRMVKDRCPQV